MLGVQAVSAAKLTRKNKYKEMDNRNLSEALPYGKLAMLGIDKEKADLLPQEVKDKLLSGEVTPLNAGFHPCAERQRRHAAA